MLVKQILKKMEKDIFFKHWDTFGSHCIFLSLLKVKNFSFIPSILRLNGTIF